MHLAGAAVDGVVHIAHGVAVAVQGLVEVAVGVVAVVRGLRQRVGGGEEPVHGVVLVTGAVAVAVALREAVA